jgi:hypothetical protein
VLWLAGNCKAAAWPWLLVKRALFRSILEFEFSELDLGSPVSRPAESIVAAIHVGGRGRREWSIAAHLVRIAGKDLGRQSGNRSSACSGKTARTARTLENSCSASTRDSGNPTQPAVPLVGACQM